MTQHWHHLCRGLAARGHEVCVVGLSPRRPGEAGPEGVRLVATPLPQPSLARRLGGWISSNARHVPIDSVGSTPTLGRRVEEVLATEEFDVACVSTGEVAGVSRYLGGLPSVLAPLDAWELNACARAELAPRALRWAYRRQLSYVRDFVRREYRAYGAIVFVSQQDAEATRTLDPTLPTRFVANGVDTDHFRPCAHPRSGKDVSFVGHMNFAPNLDAARALARGIMPIVRREHPDATLRLIGRSPGHVADLARLPGVEIVGEVPDVLPELWRSSVFACPMRLGTGVKNKVLEAFASGVPVVATPLGIRGTAAQGGEHLLLGNTDAEIARQIGLLLSSSAQVEEMTSAARDYVVEHHSWSGEVEAYEGILEEVSRAPRAVSR
ncbi:MAG TPA: glycosyltransferase family 4 protein [Solirubrobacteraceae bacterium]|nr:glycosyltransferase family 4 protein [Solirubrobacteraceae bacterium]